MTGAYLHPSGTLVARAFDAMATGPLAADLLARDILGMPNAPRAVAERLAVALLGGDPRVRQLADGRWAVAAGAAESPRLADCAFAVVDVETTGHGSLRDDRVTEVAVVVVQGERTELVYESLVNPGRPLHRAVIALTGITDAMVRAAPTFDEIADEVHAALSGRIFVAHNAKFDWGLLDGELRRARDLMLAGPRLCTVRLARRLVAEVRSCGLDSLSHHFGLDNPARHRAAGDALTTAHLLRRLLDLARGEEVGTLSELEALQRARQRHRRKRKRVDLGELTPEALPLFRPGTDYGTPA